MYRVSLPLIGALILMPTAVFAQDAPQREVDNDRMDKMSTTVTQMAEMCDQMMQQEMAMRPYKIAGAVSLGVVVALVLLLLVVLEMQWIVYWSRLLRIQRGTMARP